MKLPILPELAQRSLASSPLPRHRAEMAANPARSGWKLENLFRFCRNSRKGVAAVEFALVAPLFFLFVIGMIEIGRALMVQQVITNASREGARVAILDDTAREDVDATVERYLTSSAIPQGVAEILVDPEEPTQAGYSEPVTVTVRLGFDQVSWLPSPMFLGGNRQLTATTVMRRETMQ